MKKIIILSIIYSNRFIQSQTMILSYIELCDEDFRDGEGIIVEDMARLSN